MSIDKLKAGHELDLMVAKEVMGCRVIKRDGGTFDLIIPGGVNSIDWVEEAGAWSGCPKYSTEMAAAWSVVEHFKWNYIYRSDKDVDPTLKAGQWEVSMKRDDSEHKDRRYYSIAATAPLAICQAALRAVRL